MLDRLHLVAEVLDRSETVDPDGPAYLTLSPEGFDLEQVETILFSNLLIDVRHRAEYDGKIEFTLEWRWSWRRFAPWRTATSTLDKHIPEGRFTDYLYEALEVNLN